MKHGAVWLTAARPERYRLLAGYLQEWGYETLGGGRDPFPLTPAIVRADNPPDLLLLDLQGLNYSPAFVWSEMRAAGLPGRCALLVLGEAQEVAPYLELGVDDYLLEPLHPALFKARLRAALEGRRLRQMNAYHLQEFNELEKLADDLRLTILPLGIALSAEKELDQLLEKILLNAKEICQADAGSLFLRSEQDMLHYAVVSVDSLGIKIGRAADKPAPYHSLPLYDPESGRPNEDNVVTYVALRGHSVNIPDIYQAAHFDFSGTRRFDELRHYRSVSCLTVPLKNHDNEVSGVLQLINAIDPATGLPTSFDAYHQLVVESLASQASIALNNQLLLQRQKELLRIERDLQIGRQIQNSFLPETLPDVPGWKIAAYFQPAGEVAGDFYDVFILPGGHIGLVVADVCEKGVGAALFMALVRSLIRAYAQDERRHPGEKESADPRDQARLADILTLTNNYILANHRQAGMFATVFFGVANSETGWLWYINGGHNPPALVGPAGLKARLAPTGPAVGLKPNPDFVVGGAHLEPGDLLLAFTDGVTEARSLEDGFFAEKRLLSLLAEPAASADELLTRIEEGIRRHAGDTPPDDDMTMLAVQRL